MLPNVSQCNHRGVDALTGETVGGCTELPVNGIRIVKCQEDA